MSIVYVILTIITYIKITYELFYSNNIILLL